MVTKKAVAMLCLKEFNSVFFVGLSFRYEFDLLNSMAKLMNFKYVILNVEVMILCF